MLGGLWVEEGSSAVLEEEGGDPLSQASHGLRSEVTYQQVGLSVNERHQLPSQTTVVLLWGEMRREVRMVENDCLGCVNNNVNFIICVVLNFIMWCNPGITSLARSLDFNNTDL